jgi:hypothetical protein
MRSTHGTTDPIAPQVHHPLPSRFSTNTLHDFLKDLSLVAIDASRVTLDKRQFETRSSVDELITHL